METRELEVAVRRREGVSVIDLAGELNASAEAALQQGYEEAAREGGPVVLNFSGADYINSTGIALIVGLLAQARTHGVEVTACGLSDHYREIFEITRLADFMRIIENEDGAVGGAEGRDGA
jgi:anti-anti-sigma factor